MFKLKFYDQPVEETPRSQSKTVCISDSFKKAYLIYKSNSQIPFWIHRKIDHLHTLCLPCIIIILHWVVHPKCLYQNLLLYNRKLTLQN